MPVPDWVLVSVREIQSIMTHEAGHVLGLNHPEAEANGVLTMATAVNGWRHVTTLGLGDVLGARALYPWTCPAPGQPIPPRYERLCPSIQIFAP